MPQRDSTGIGERVPRELIDADFAIAFNLVEMAEAESLAGNERVASQLLEQAGQILDGVRGRMLRMTQTQKDEFEPRCAALAEKLQGAQSPDSAIAPESDV